MPRRDDTFIIYYAEDFEEYETDNPSNLYCLSQSSIDVILSALRFATWPTRWRTDRQDYRGKVSPTEWGNLRKWGELAIQEVTYEMGCDINEGLSAIAVSLQSLADATKSNSSLLNRAIASASACCEQQVVNQGGGVIGHVTQPVGGNEYPIFGTEPLLEVPGGTFPDGYEDEAEYLTDKCQMSNLVVSGVIGTLRGLGALGVFNGITLAGLIVACLVGVIVFPPAFIPIAAAAIGLLSVEVTLLTLAANEIESNRDEWVCAIYNSESTEAALAIIADLIDALIAAIGATDLRAMAVKQILLLLFNGDTVNQAFQKTAHVVYPDADCSGCVVDCGEPGTPAHFPIFSNVGDGTWSFTSNLFRLDATVNGGAGIGYRYSGYFGGTWPTPPFPARKALSVDCSTNIDGTAQPQGGGGYFQLFGSDLSIPDGAPSFRVGTTGWGYEDLADVNSWLDQNDVCLSIIVVSDASVASWLEVSFQAP